MGHAGASIALDLPCRGLREKHWRTNCEIATAHRGADTLRGLRCCFRSRRSDVRASVRARNTRQLDWRRRQRPSPCAVSAICARERNAWLGRYYRPGTCDPHRAQSPSAPQLSTHRRSSGLHDRSGCTERLARKSERTETFALRHQPPWPPRHHSCPARLAAVSRRGVPATPTEPRPPRQKMTVPDQRSHSSASPFSSRSHARRGKDPLRPRSVTRAQIESAPGHSRPPRLHAIALQATRCEAGRTTSSI